MEHRLLRGQLRNRWENTTSVTGEKNDVGRVPFGDAGDLRVLDVFDGVCTGVLSVSPSISREKFLPSGVFGEGAIIIVHNTSDRVEHDVLQDRTKFDGVEDIRLLLDGQPDALGVTLHKTKIKN
jgi:hypothetical protein